MAITEIYVDPSIAADSGAGTIGDPYGDLEWALETATYGSAGTRFNVKAGTAEVLGAKLETALATGGKTSTETDPVIIQGYTATAGDGGIGQINCNATVGMFEDGAANFIALVNLEIYNAGATQRLVYLGTSGAVIECNVHGAPGNDAIFINSAGVVTDSYIHDFASMGARTGGGGYIARNFFRGDGTTPTQIIFAGPAIVEHNIITVPATFSSQCIYLSSNHSSADGNSIYAAAGATGTGIWNTANSHTNSIRNNLVEGFSGTGGKGIDLSGTNANVLLTGGNSVYNCATAFVAAGGYEILDFGGDETLGASPFTAPGTDDFSPVDTGSVKEGSLPNIIGGGLVP